MSHHGGSTRSPRAPRYDLELLETLVWTDWKANWIIYTHEWL